MDFRVLDKVKDNKAKDVEIIRLQQDVQRRTPLQVEPVRLVYYFGPGSMMS